MENQKETSSIKIILFGELMVNLPVLLVIFLTTFLSFEIGIGWMFSWLIGSGAGWFVWEKLLLKWKTWAFDQNISKERLFRLGKLGFINFYKDRIFDDETELPNSKNE